MCTGALQVRFQIHSEREEKLDPLNEVDFFFFLPRINKCLSEFQQSWNHHALSSEGNKTPLQLMFEGLIHPSNEAASGVDTNTDVDVSQFTGDRVAVPRNHFAPCASLQQDLCSIDPLQFCGDNGVSFYVSAIELCGIHLSSRCSHCSLSQ